ncbi:kinase-like domain-containing protein [Cladorrhinum sp. PSN332]|nr:kinase-like domain-containing protein [Cladorrhinum sp. PSN332]
MALFRQLKAGIVTSALDDSKFIPLDVLNRTITVESITQSLGPASKLWAYCWSDQLPRQIHQDAKKVFSILVLIGNVPAIHRLLSNGLTDKDLPLFRKDVTDVLISKTTHKEFAVFESWDPVKLDAFLEKQWLVQAPVIEWVGQNLELDDKCPLPLVEKGEKVGGGNGVWVHQARVHPAHRSAAFAAATDGLLAIKEIADRETFLTERQNLDNMQAFPHQNLIKPLGTIERGSLFYVIFPWAHGGDLRQLWERQDSSSDSRKYIKWSLEQMLGLVGGIKLLHGNNIRHGDIKPQNVLHFIDPGDPNAIADPGDPLTPRLGSLVLADVGVSKRHVLATHVRHWATTTNAVTISYEAPEAEYDRHNGIPRSRKYDQWSLGCMFLEFTVWLLYGFQAVEVFRRRRTSSREDPTTAPGNFFTQQSYGSVSIHSRVSRAIKHLRDDPRCGKGTALGDLLTLVETRLLQIKPDQRADATTLYATLEGILTKALEDRDYLSKNLEKTPEVPKFFSKRSRRGSSSSQSSAWSSADTRGSRSSFSSTSSGFSNRTSRSSFSSDGIARVPEEALVEDGGESG